MSLLVVWITNIALYSSVKRRPTLSAGEPNSSQSTESNVLSQLKKKRSSLTLLTSIGRHFSAVTIESTISVESKQASTHRKKLEVGLAKTVRYIVIAFTLALLPGVITMLVSGFPALSISSIHFDSLANAAWTASSYLGSRFLFLNSAFNCCIYSCRSKEFRTRVKMLFSRIKFSY